MDRQKFSLSFSKKIEKKSLQPSALGHNTTETQQKAKTQALLAVDQDSLKINENAEESELVIPLLQAKRSAVLSRLAKLHQEDGPKEEGEEARQEVQEESKPLTLEEKAERALLDETKKKLDQWSLRDGKSNITIPAAAADDSLAAPLVDIGKESSLDDYEEVSVESYGAAILRGMGWKKTEGIGGRKKMVVDIINPSARTLGSSEGREDSKKKEGEEDREEEEELPIVKGSFVFLHSGRHRGTYGLVEVVDEDHLLIKPAMGHTMIREVEGNLRAASQKEYKESARVINKEMYDKYKEAEIKKNETQRKRQHEEGDEEERDERKERKRSPRNRESETQKQNERMKEGREEKNRDMNDIRQREETREREHEKDRRRDRDRERDKDSERQRDRNSDRQNYNDNEADRNRPKDRERKQTEKETEKQKHRETKQEFTDNPKQDRRERGKDRDRRERDREQKSKHHHQGADNQGIKRRKEQSPEAQSKAKYKREKVMVPPWVRENMRVRLINKNYKGGKYHKEKVVVMNVVTAECCECVAEGGRRLGDVDPAWLETVIPKQPPMIVMVVRGHHSGQKGRILQLHKEQEKASIQLLEDETTILKLHYDDICEYVLR